VDAPPARGSEAAAIAGGNAKLYLQVTKIWREIGNAAQAFAIEEARLQRQIHMQVEKCSKREKEIVEEIYEWNLIR
jgi:hypothetical protein